ncbi:acetylserotonin O-methyltransferase [Orycteropus afer afer]|uniref:Acetylserotonin O-methyltransferase n=1 Tax=Orycteropus afer afer TaxID=1230840 RepID=A0A8B7BC55_ORYAF|nr:acetylserotonin O-methyltransferase [Orycteropus afer afer]
MSLVRGSHGEQVSVDCHTLGGVPGGTLRHSPCPPVERSRLCLWARGGPESGTARRQLTARRKARGTPAPHRAAPEREAAPGRPPSSGPKAAPVRPAQGRAAVSAVARRLSAAAGSGCLRAAPRCCRCLEPGGWGHVGGQAPRVLSALGRPRPRNPELRAVASFPGCPEVVFAACELGVFDLLAEAPEPLSSAVVAERLGTSPHGTELLLDACASLELLTVETRGQRALYQNTALSRSFLTRSSPRSQQNMLLYLSRTTYLCWGHLAAAVREGRNQYTEVFGVPSAELFTAIYRSEAERVRFMRGLQEVWSVHGAAVMGAFDLSPFRFICDLGGGSGALARECAALYPECRVVVFDTPDVVCAARSHFSFPGAQQVSFQEGDFFKDPLPEADLYVLARVLHDWPDEKCSHLLARVHHACRPGGGVLVVESLLAEDRRGPLTTQLYSLNMLVQTEGRERTPGEYRALVSAAGFQDFCLKKTGRIYDVILARK